MTGERKRLKEHAVNTKIITKKKKQGPQIMLIFYFNSLFDTLTHLFINATNGCVKRVLLF